ncbi:MAG TPA: bifunctional phosphopantothenoylcysteine decarboxylase/phosphopantothenate synthase [Solirubrobacteraceae bacterium]|nr:bifunctional phosphopantothenoylcysteine decarboxylase/phosphopantothenate synthase [Solirubrobacteraceae bacterium]
MSRILLGVSGGIAAYKALELVRLATAAGHTVRVVQTPTSRRFVGQASFEALTGAPVLVSEFERDPTHGAFPDQTPPAHAPLSHLALVEAAEVYLIAPASANTLAKLAAGLADNLLTSAALAASCPLVLAPAMNNRMYAHPATQANLATLRARGAIVVEPDSGRLASKGEEGVGRLAAPARLLAACKDALEGRAGADANPHADANPRADASLHADVNPLQHAGAHPHGGSLAGLKVLVSAGGTREPIDSVRFLGNSSSGRMGLALAQAARERGAQVTLVAANVALPTPAGVQRRDVGSAAEMQQVCEQEFPACDVLLMAAAVADFTPAAPANGKLKKSARERLQLTLEPTADILAMLAARRRDGQTLVGFAAEHGEGALDYARGKLVDKHLDAIVVNDIARADIGFNVDANEVTILTATGDRHVPRASKAHVASAVLDAVESLRGSS